MSSMLHSTKKAGAPTTAARRRRKSTRTTTMTLDEPATKRARRPATVKRVTPRSASRRKQRHTMAPATPSEKNALEHINRQEIQIARYVLIGGISTNADISARTVALLAVCRLKLFINGGVTHRFCAVSLSSLGVNRCARRLLMASIWKDIGEMALYTKQMCLTIKATLPVKGMEATTLAMCRTLVDMVDIPLNAVDRQSLLALINALQTRPTSRKAKVSDIKLSAYCVHCFERLGGQLKAVRCSMCTLQVHKAHRLQQCPGCIAEAYR